MDLTVTDKVKVFIAQLGKEAKLDAMRVMKTLQGAQIRFSESIDRDGMQPQLKLADRLGVKWVVIIGHKEVLDKTVILRNMESGMQETIKQDELVDELKKRLEIEA
jgi:histidyl-tRNA synthetase